MKSTEKIEAAQESQPQEPTLTNKILYKKIDGLQQQALKAAKVLLDWSIENAEIAPEQCRKNIETIMQYFKLI